MSANEPNTNHTPNLTENLAPSENDLRILDRIREKIAANEIEIAVNDLLDLIRRRKVLEGYQDTIIILSADYRNRENLFIEGHIDLPGYEVRRKGLLKRLLMYLNQLEQEVRFHLG